MQESDNLKEFEKAYDEVIQILVGKYHLFNSQGYGDEKQTIYMSKIFTEFKNGLRKLFTQSYLDSLCQLDEKDKMELL